MCTSSFGKKTHIDQMMPCVILPFTLS